MIDINMQEKWEKLHAVPRYRPIYPSEIVVQFVFKNFPRNSNAKILDLGCGAGRHLLFLAQESYDAYGTDISKEGLLFSKKLLKEKNLDAHLFVANASSLPFCDNFFDGLISYGVLYYCMKDEIIKSIKEIHRVLKPNGKANIIVRNTNDHRYGKGEEIEENTFIINEENIDKSSHSENGMAMHFFTEDEVKELFCDFSKLSVDIIGQSFENQDYYDNDFIINVAK